MMHGPTHIKFDVQGFNRCQGWPAFKTHNTLCVRMCSLWMLRMVVYIVTTVVQMDRQCKMCSLRAAGSLQVALEDRQMAVRSAGKGSKQKNTNCLLFNRHYTVNRTNLISCASVHITDSKESSISGQARPDKALRVAAQERYWNRHGSVRVAGEVVCFYIHAIFISPLFLLTWLYAL